MSRLALVKSVPGNVSLESMLFAYASSSPPANSNRSSPTTGWPTDYSMTPNATSLDTATTASQAGDLTGA